SDATTERAADAPLDPSGVEHADHASSPSSPSQAATSASAMFTCPMHPEVRQPGGGDCPECGMALEPDVATQATEYVCPMHPEIVRSEPGSCPICGMALEPRTAIADDD